MNQERSSGPALSDRGAGALLGLAVGDALGATVEFMPPGTFEPVTDMVGGGPHRLAPGQWTDDTSMALCLAESLVECDGFDPLDQMQRYVRWYREGYLSSTGVCFDIGNATRAALHRFEESGDPYAGSEAANTAGNGLEAALWAFDRSDDFREGLLLAVNLGDDADTTGAVYGQIAGAYYGVEGIPRE